MNIIYSSSGSENGAPILCLEKYFENLKTLESILVLSVFRVQIITLHFSGWEMNSS